jgi:crotonobetainyl-CoA:carnitine CoA-transferase CaiB-like acyl-CoA transferase
LYILKEQMKGSEIEFIKSGSPVQSESQKLVPGTMNHPLSHTIVLDLAAEQTAFCAKLLADLGATVIKVEGPSGDPLRKLRPASFFYNNTNKFGIVVDLTAREGMRTLRSLVKRADILVETFPPGSSILVDLHPHWLRRLNPRLIHISITPFGRTSLTNVRLPDAPPGLPGCQPHYVASLFGAVAALIRLTKRKITGKGSYLDLSMHEAVASMLEHRLGTAGSPGRRGRGEDFSTLRARDGYVLIPILRSWDTLIEIMASDGKGGDLIERDWENPSRREQKLDHIIKVVEDWAGGYARREILELGQAMRFPWAAIDSVDEVFENPQLKSRQFFFCSPPSQIVPPRSFPGIPFQFGETPDEPPRPAPLLGEHTQVVLEEFGVEQQKKERASCSAHSRYPDERILEGIRVVDLTRMISGPYATRIFADFGAEVIKIQSGRTAHGAEEGNTHFFSIWNRNKRGMNLDLSLPAARDTMLKLVAESDILFENFSPRVMANWGLGYGRLREENPALVMVSISAMGQTGPWRDFVGFAPTFHAMSGLLSAITREGNPPSDLDYPYADLVTGLYAALAAFAALEFRNRTGKGQHIDLSALEATCTFDALLTDEHQMQPGSINLTADSQLIARRFFVQLDHPVLGKALSARTPLWDWRRKPRWKPFSVHDK